MKIEIGKTRIGEQVSYNYVPYNSRSVLINGISGSHKSTLLFSIASRFMTTKPEENEKRPNIVYLDIDDSESRLREVNPDMIIIGGSGEIPLDIKYAKELGRQVRLQNLDVVVQLANFNTDEELEEFVSLFLSGLMLNEGKFSDVCNPIVLFCDEAQDICGNKGAKQKSRDAMKKAVKRGRKFGVVSFFAVLGINDFYQEARSQCENSIVGYTKEPLQRRTATERLGLEPTQTKLLLELGEEPKGRFYCQGNDISRNAVMVQLESKKYVLQRNYIPQISKAGLEKVENLRQSLNHITVSNETLYQNKIKQLQCEVMKLSMNQMTQDHEAMLLKEGELKGWKSCVENHRSMIEEIRKSAGKKTLFGKPPNIIVNSVVINGKETLVIDNG